MISQDMDRPLTKVEAWCPEQKDVTSFPLFRHNSVSKLPQHEMGLKNKIKGGENKLQGSSE